jgi:hypothetical protein
MSDDDFGWRPPRRHDIRNTFGKRRPAEGRQSVNRSPSADWLTEERSERRAARSQARIGNSASWAMPRGLPRQRSSESLSPDDIVRHERHGIGVVVAVGEVECDVRFCYGRFRLDPARVSVVLHARDAQQFLADVLATHKANASTLQGAALWLRSTNHAVASVAVEIFSRTKDPKAISMAVAALSECGDSKRQRIENKISGARVKLGLPDWAETVRTLALPTERATETSSSPSEVVHAPNTGTGEDDLVRQQLEIIDRIRSHLGEPSLTGQQRETIRSAVLAKLKAPDQYLNKCWHCGAPVHSRFNPRCPVCGWLSCVCGACRKPDYVDRSGTRQPICPREERLIR